MKTLILFILILPITLWGEWSVPFYETLAKTPDSLSVLKTVEWLVQVISYLIFTYLILITGRELSKENYLLSGATFIGAIIAGTAPYIARALI